NAQVLGISVDWHGANKAWAQEMGVTYPLMSDLQRLTTRAYGVLYDYPKLDDDSMMIPLDLRAKGAWFVIDKAGGIRAAKIVPLGQQIATDEILQVLESLK
ncbi:MAG TPA: redoxin domain-containing protein, partial [Candidatus Tectomicrobia bacterium]